MAMPAIAVTDHGVMFGALGFYEAARAHGIKPILGVEAYVAPGSRSIASPARTRSIPPPHPPRPRRRGDRISCSSSPPRPLEGSNHRPRMDQRFSEHA